MKYGSLNEEVIKRLPAPSTGTAFPILRPREYRARRHRLGYGARVTAAGAKSFVLNYRVGL